MGPIRDQNKFARLLFLARLQRWLCGTLHFSLSEMLFPVKQKRLKLCDYLRERKQVQQNVPSRCTWSKVRVSYKITNTWSYMSFFFFFGFRLLRKTHRSKESPLRLHIKAHLLDPC